MIQRDGSTYHGHAGSGNVTLASVVVNSHTNRKLIVRIGSHQGGPATSVTYGGVSMTKTAEQIGSFGEFVQIWELVNPSVGTASVVTSGISGGDFTFVAADVLYNCKQSTSTISAQATGSSNIASLSITPPSANDWILDVIEAEPTPTVHSGQTQDFSEDGVPNSYDNGNGSSVSLGAIASQTMRWDLAYGARWNQAAVAIEPDSTSPTKTFTADGIIFGRNTKTIVLDGLIVTAGGGVPPTGLQYLGVDIMSETKDLLDNPDSQTQIDALINAITSHYSTISHIGISIPMNTNAEAISVRGTPFTIDPAAYALRFTSRIHANHKKVLWRGTDCYFEGLYGFPTSSFRNGNRFTYFADVLTDGGFTDLANWILGTDAGNTWTVSGGEAIGPAGDGWKRTLLYNANHLRDVTMVAKVKKVGNQQIVIHATQDPNFPGYGFQLRTGEFRLERPGLSQLATTPKTFVEGSYYWIKAQAVGTTIQGKVWLDGTSEPGPWDFSVTDATYVSGYCGMSGESDNGHFNNVTITPVKDTQSWLTRVCDWISTNISLFSNGDIIAPLPEASSHQGLTNDGDYNTFFVDLKYCLDRICTNNGLTCKNGLSSHIWTSVIQGAITGQVFSIPGMVSVDHYGTAIGLNERFGSFNGAASNAGTDGYTLPTIITENATNRFDFIPEKVAYNKDIDVFILDKGTGDITMTIHALDNSLVQMPDHTNLNNKTTTGVRTILNANLVNNAYNTFSIDWDNPDTDVTYHYHLTSSNGTGKVQTTIGSGGNLNACVCNGYKYNATPEAIEIDIRKTYLKTGFPIYLQEWGDYWSLDSSRSNPTRTAAEQSAYLASMYAAFQRLINDGVLQGFNYWRVLGGFEATMVDTNPPNFAYDNNNAGLSLQAFLNNNIVSTHSNKTFTVDGIIKVKANTTTFTVDGLIIAVGGPKQTFTVDGIIFDATASVSSGDIIKELMRTTPIGVFKGVASYVSPVYTQLTVNTPSQFGGLEYTKVMPSSFIIEADMYADGAADAGYVYWGQSSTPFTEDAANGGYIVALDEYALENIPVFVQFNGVIVAQSAYPYFLGDKTIRKLKVVVDGRRIRVYVNNVKLIDFTDALRSLGGLLVGVAARTGGAAAEHRCYRFYAYQVSSPWHPTPTLSGLATLKYRIIDVMKWTKDIINNQPNSQTIVTIVNILKATFNLTHIAISVPLDIDADYVANGTIPSPTSISSFTQLWCDAIHAAGLGVLFRGDFNELERSGPSGNWNFKMAVGVNRTPLGTIRENSSIGLLLSLTYPLEFPVTQSTLLGKIYSLIVNNPGWFHNNDLFGPLPERTENNTTSVLISSITRVGSLATVVCAGNSNVANQQPVAIFGAGQPEYNGSFINTKVNDTTFTIQVAGTPITPATGSMHMQFGNSVFTDENSWIPNTGSGVTANYAQFFADLQSTADAAFNVIGKKVKTGFTANNYSEISSNWIPNTLFTKAQRTAVDYYGSDHTPGEMYNNLIGIYKSKGQVIDHEEWADYWNGSLSQSDRSDYLIDFYNMLTQLNNEGLYEMLNYWGGWVGGSGEGILTDLSSGGNTVFGITDTGAILAEFLNVPVTVPVSVISGIPYGFYLNGVKMKNPTAFNKEYIYKKTEWTTLMGKTVRDISHLKQKYTLGWKNLNKTQVDAINTIMKLEVPVSFTVNGKDLVVVNSLVWCYIGSIVYETKGSDYLATVSIELVEVS